MSDACDTPVAHPAPALCGVILGAALALPGIAPSAHAEPPPDAQVGARYLDYRDRQPGLDRVTVRSPSVWFVTPIGSDWSAAGTLGTDSVSGASPAWHASISSASRFSDRRTTGDWRVTRHFARSTLSVGAVHSDEDDYRSRALSIAGSLSSDDGNTTWALAVGGAWDTLNPSNNRVRDAERRATDVLATVTRVLTPVDVVQVGLGVARYEGYLDDPYKTFDQRPDSRDQALLQLRWNHHFADGALGGSTLRTSYRGFRDSWGVRAHTLAAEWVRPVGHGWTLTPLVRLHSQSAARFYYDPVYDPRLGAPFPPGWLASRDAERSSDARLSAFGAASVGLRTAVAFAGGWSAELRTEWYRQKASWRAFGDGSPGLATLDARIVQLSVNRRF